MRVRQLTAYVVRLPFKRRFSHASATRHESENVLARCELADGTCGWGEGVPRSYVTGETPAGCLEQLAKTPVGELLRDDCATWLDVLRMCERFTPFADRDDPRGCYGNALRCAVEISILDAFGRLLGEPVSAVTSHYEPARAIRMPQKYATYSAVIDSGNDRLWRKALVRRLYGFRDCKVKVGAAGDDDITRLQTTRRWIGPSTDLRIDVNEAWAASETRGKLESLTPYGISCVEQPVPHAEVSSLAELRRHVAVPVMLDESLTSAIDAEAAITGGTCDLFNIRLSKCGGFLASLRLAAMAHAAGLGYQLGCHPGETGILSAAGRHWACSVANVRYVEGSYDRYLFRRLLTHEDITFGFGGRGPALTGRGLGVTVDDAALRELATDRQEFGVN
jgi:muconate cycloisomerase